jgi:hypothetical protein
LRDHEESAACRLALYQQLALHPHLADGDSGHLVCYFDQQKKWHQQFFGRFVDWVADPSLVHATGLDRFELALRPPTAPADGVEVRLAEREDLVAATALVRSQLPELLARAWDVHPERLTSKALHDDYASTPYERGRRALVLSVDGQLQGVALCETSAPELSLFNILNMAQIFLARGRSTPTAAAQAALLTAVSRLYAARGEPAPIVVAPPGTLDPAQHPGLRKEETMGCIVFSGRALGLYTSFLSFTVGSYRSRKQAATSLPHPSRSESNA